MIMKLLLLLIISFPCLTAEESPPYEYMVKQPNCPYRCGNVSIPFPFGIGESCYLNGWYSVNCSNNTSSDAAKLFLNHTELNLELLNISLEHRTVTINSPIASWPGGSTSSLQKSIDLGQSPFLFSRRANIFVVLGCGHAHLIEHGEIWAGCTSSCNRSYTAQGCYGINCCQTTFPSTMSYYLNNYNVSFNSLDDTTGEKNSSTTTTTTALLVDGDWFSGNFTKPEDVVGVGHAPLSLLWTMKHSDLDKPNPNCDEYTYNSSSGESYQYYSCYCGWSYEGNPYLIDGCHVVKGCANCLGTCDSRYNSTSNDYDFYCNMKNRVKAFILGFSIGGGSLLLLLGSFVLYKVVKKKRDIRRKRQFFK